MVDLLFIFFIHHLSRVYGEIAAISPLPPDTLSRRINVPLISPGVKGVCRISRAFLPQNKKIPRPLKVQRALLRSLSSLLTKDMTESAKCLYEVMRQAEWSLRHYQRLIHSEWRGGWPNLRRRRTRLRLALLPRTLA